MARPAGGYISGYTAPTVNAAVGVWSLRDTFQLQRASAWLGVDPYIANVQLLLHGEGSSVVDSSPAARTVTSYGTAGVSATRSKFGAQSLSTPTTSSGFSVPRTASLLVGSSDFTIEAWVWASSVSQSGTILFGPAAFSWAIYVGIGSWGYYLSTNGTSYNVANGTSMGTPIASQWNHIALVRSGSTFSPYINGVRGITATSSAAIAAPTSTVGATVGEGFGGTYGYAGLFIDDVRLTIGTARYSGASFTVPTAEFANR